MLRRRTLIFTACLIALIASSALAQQSIPWAPNLRAAVQSASRDNRLVLLHFWAPGCGPCMTLERDVFSRNDVAQAIARDFVPVKINAEAMPEMARKYKVDRWPMDVIITPAGYPLHSMVSPQDPREYMQTLYRVASKRQPGNRLSANPADPVAAAEPRGQQQNWRSPPRESMASGNQFTGGNEPSPYGDSQFTSQQQRQSRFGPQSSQFGPAYANQFEGSQQDQFRSQQPPREQALHSMQPRGGGSQFGAAPADNPYVNEPRPGAGHFSAQDAAPPQGMANQQPAPQAAPPAADRPPLGLEGYCPVTLISDGKWVHGDKRFGIVHRGRLYLFASDAQKQIFWQDPDRYAPILSGNDPVVFVDGGQVVQGSRKHGVFYRDQIYLFTSEDSLQRFSHSPQRYADIALQAMARAAERRLR